MTLKQTKDGRVELVDALNEQTRLLDEERRRWYKALETEFGLRPNCLEGLSPEVAADTVRRSLLV